MMNRAQLDEDVKPISEFRSNASALLSQVRKTHRPLVLTQNGRAAAVMLDVGDYENLLQTIEVQRDLSLAEEQIRNGHVSDAEEAKKRILARIRR